MFSVLLSLYAKESPTFLASSLDSIFHQTLLPDEIILVKDGPLTVELDAIVSDYAARYPILKVIPLPQNQGLGKALNEGLKHCSYDIVARMDTDDISKPDRFEKQIAVFRKHPELDLVGAWIDEFEEDIHHVISTRKLPERHEDVMSYATRRNPINHPVVMFSASAPSPLPRFTPIIEAMPPKLPLPDDSPDSGERVTVTAYSFGMLKATTRATTTAMPQVL